jgi:hypothetical protein
VPIKPLAPVTKTLINTSLNVSWNVSQLSRVGSYYKSSVVILV